MAKNKSKEAAATATTATPAVTPIQMQNYPAFMPGQQGLLAEQMSAGYGAPVSENMGLLSNLYKPVNMPIISRPDQIAQYLTQIGLTPVTTDAKAAEKQKSATQSHKIGYGGGDGDGTGYGYNKRGAA